MINNKDIKVGSIFKLMPGKGSHSPDPYHVRVVAIDSYGFETVLYGDPPKTNIPPHTRRFEFNSREWESYHRPRFIKT
jgi:hypothetical protein